MKKKMLVFETKPSNIKLDYISDDAVRVSIFGDMSVGIEFDNDVLLKTKGDFIVASKGEINFITDGKPISIESLNSQIYLNSREAKYIKDLPESILYREKLKEENKKDLQIATLQELQTKTLKERVSILENKLDGIGKLLKEYSIKLEI